MGKSESTFWDRYDGGKWWKYTSNEPLKEDYTRYGPDAFVVNLLEVGLSGSDLSFVEAVYIRSLNAAHPNGYNLKNYSINGEEKMTQRAIDNVLAGKRLKKLNHPEQVRPRKMTPAQLAEHTARNTGCGNGMFGKKHSDETREKIRRKALGRRHSEVTRENAVLNARRGAAHHKSRPVLQIDAHTGNVMARFDSANMAAVAVGTRRTNIYEALKTGNKSAGFAWKHAA